MRNRVIALALAIAAIAFGAGHVRRPRIGLASTSEVMRLFPPGVGPFRIVARRDDKLGAYGWGTYRDSHGYTIDLMVNYGLRGPHNSIGCYWSLAQDPSWHQLVALKSLNSTVVFDVAIFTDAEATARLIGSTECWTDGCTESSYAPFCGWIWPSLDVWLGKAEPPIPVAIAIKLPVATGDKTALLGVLKSFVGGLNLADVQRFSATRRLLAAPVA